MGEKSLALNKVTLTSKRDIASAYAQVKVLQDEIEASRERAESVIQVGPGSFSLISLRPKAE